MRILVYGSTYLSAITSEFLIKNSNYELIGYIPNHKRVTIPGKMPIPVTSEDTPSDMILSLQYDKIIINTEKSFNVHTGLLPEYGGVDILYHTIKNKSKEQGITFHKITKDLDYGPIISKISYPVLPEDTVEILYKRLAIIFPSFVLSSLKLLETIPWDKINYCHSETPIIYKSGQILKKDMDDYYNSGLNLKNLFK